MASATFAFTLSSTTFLEQFAFRTENADQTAYFSLYDDTAETLKSVDPVLRVGSPSTAGAAWVPEFLAHVKQSGAPVDFISTHTYGVDGGFLDEKGQSDTKLSASPDAIVGDVRRVRQQVAASASPNLPVYFTEWSTSYTPRDAVHDSYVSARRQPRHGCTREEQRHCIDFFNEIRVFEVTLARRSCCGTARRLCRRS